VTKVLCSVSLPQVDHTVDHFTNPEGEPGKPETNYNNRPNSFMVMSPSRSCQVRNLSGNYSYHTSHSVHTENLSLINSQSYI
jgi:hypothetical protein